MRLIIAVRRLLAKARGLFGKREEHSDLETEIADHLDLLAERYVRQGMTQEQARQAARRQFGNALAGAQDGAAKPATLRLRMLLGSAPTIVSTSWLLRKIRTVGIERTLYWLAMAG